MFIAAVIWGRGDNNLTSVSGATFSGTEENDRTEWQLVERSLLMLAEIPWPPPAGLCLSPAFPQLVDLNYFEQRFY